MSSNIITLNYSSAYIEQRLEDVISMLHRLQEKQASRSGLAEIHQIEADLTVAPAPLSHSFDRTYRLFHHLHRVCFNLLEERVGKVYCKQCPRLYLADQLTFETYKRGWKEVPLMGGEGRRFYCGAHQHLLLEIVDRRS